MEKKLLTGGNRENKTISIGGVNSFINNVKFYYNKKNSMSVELYKKLKQFQKSIRRSKLLQQYIRLLLVFFFGLFVYKLYLHMMSFLTKDDIYRISYHMQDHFNYGYEIIRNQTPYWIPILTPILCGILFSFFSFMIVLLDSKIPGTYPPSPFSPKSKNEYKKQKSFSIDLSYTTALLSGIVVAFLMLYCF